MQKEQAGKNKTLIVVGKILLAILAYLVPVFGAQIFEDIWWPNRLIIAFISVMILLLALPARIQRSWWLVGCISFSHYFIMTTIFTLSQGS